MNWWAVLVLAALGAMKLTDFVKEIIPWPLQPWTRTLVSLVWATVLCALLSSGKPLVLLITGSAGLASLLHEIVSVLSMKSDDLKQTIMVRAVTARRR
jgi:hypothetical protein